MGGGQTQECYGAFFSELTTGHPAHPQSSVAVPGDEQEFWGTVAGIPSTVWASSGLFWSVCQVDPPGPSLYALCPGPSGSVPQKALLLSLIHISEPTRPKR